MNRQRKAFFGRHRRALPSHSAGISVVLAVAPLALAACHSDYRRGPDTQPVAAQTAKLIIDQTNNPGPASVTGFYWIPPVIQTAATFTTLDTTGGTNSMTVRIDRLYADSSTDAAAKATFTGTGITLVTASRSGSFPGVVGPFYGVNWTPGTGVASGQTYRVSIQALTPLRVLGVVDVQVVANAAAIPGLRAAGRARDTAVLESGGMGLHARRGGAGRSRWRTETARPAAVTAVAVSATSGCGYVSD